VIEEHAPIAGREHLHPDMQYYSMLRSSQHTSQVTVPSAATGS
jgi:hypothetical protein